MSTNSSNLYLNGFSLLSFNIKDKSLTYKNYQKNKKINSVKQSENNNTTTKTYSSDWWIVKENDTYSIIERPANLVIDTLKYIEAGPFINRESANEMLLILNSYKKED